VLPQVAAPVQAVVGRGQLMQNLPNFWVHVTGRYYFPGMYTCLQAEWAGDGQLSFGLSQKVLSLGLKYKAVSLQASARAAGDPCGVSDRRPILCIRWEWRDNAEERRCRSFRAEWSHAMQTDDRTFQFL
jgi:hypothetical protein